MAGPGELEHRPRPQRLDLDASVPLDRAVDNLLEIERIVGDAKRPDPLPGSKLFGLKLERLEHPNALLAGSGDHRYMMCRSRRAW